MPGSRPAHRTRATTSRSSTDGRRPARERCRCRVTAMRRELPTVLRCSTAPATAWRCTSAEAAAPAGLDVPVPVVTVGPPVPVVPGIADEAPTRRGSGGRAARCDRAKRSFAAGGGRSAQVRRPTEPLAQRYRSVPCRTSHQRCRHGSGRPLSLPREMRGKRQRPLLSPLQVAASAAAAGAVAPVGPGMVGTRVGRISVAGPGHPRCPPSARNTTGPFHRRRTAGAQAPVTVSSASAVPSGAPNPTGPPNSGSARSAAASAAASWAAGRPDSGRLAAAGSAGTASGVGAGASSALRRTCGPVGATGAIADEAAGPVVPAGPAPTDLIVHAGPDVPAGRPADGTVPVCAGPKTGATRSVAGPEPEPAVGAVLVAPAEPAVDAPPEPEVEAAREPCTPRCGAAVARSHPRHPPGSAQPGEPLRLPSRGVVAVVDGARIAHRLPVDIGLRPGFRCSGCCSRAGYRRA